MQGQYFKPIFFLIAFCFCLFCSYIYWYMSKLSRQKEVIVRAESTLILSHAMFRHGNRLPELSDMYPNDPYYNFSYYPLNHGDLTKVRIVSPITYYGDGMNRSDTYSGKQKAYSIGQALRERYDTFLGLYYTQNLVESWTTDRNRAKMSLLLVLAGLFPPENSEMWNSKLTWQPIPYNYRPDRYDPWLYGLYCPAYLAEFRIVLKSPGIITEYNEYADTFSYIAKYSGLNITTFLDIYRLYFALSTEEEFGFDLPSWTERVWPDIIKNITYKQYGIYTRTTLQKKIAAGYWLQKMMIDTDKSIKNESYTKLYLYSAHENNIGQLLTTLDLFEYPHIPPYGAYILFEVHLINDIYGFKIYYQNYNGTATPKLLKLPTCEEFCPLDTFKTLIEEYMPEDGLC